MDIKKKLGILVLLLVIPSTLALTLEENTQHNPYLSNVTYNITTTWENITYYYLNSTCLYIEDIVDSYNYCNQSSTPIYIQIPFSSTTWINTSWFNLTNCTTLDVIQQYRTQYDIYYINLTNITYYQNISCNYCNYDLLYTSWSSWSEPSFSCGKRTRTYYDLNYTTCCNVTGLATDCIGLDNSTISYNYTETDLENCNELIGGETVDIYGLFFLLQFLAVLGILGFKIWNISTIPEKKKDPNNKLSLKVPFLTFSAFLIAWFIGFVIFLAEPEELLYMQLIKLESLGLGLMVILTFIEVIMCLAATGQEGIRKRYNSKSN
jgi:hypothetical protein